MRALLALALAAWAGAAAPAFDPATLTPAEDALYQPIKGDPELVRRFTATRSYLLASKADPDHAAPMPAEVEFRFTVDKAEKLLLFRIMVAQGLKRAFS